MLGLRVDSTEVSKGSALFLHSLTSTDPTHGASIHRALCTRALIAQTYHSHIASCHGTWSSRGTTYAVAVDGAHALNTAHTVPFIKR